MYCIERTTRKVFGLTIALALLHLSSVFAQQIRVSGLVKDALGINLPGTSILVKGSGMGTKTDSAGKFSLSLNTGDQLLFSAVGYADTAVQIGSQSIIVIVMHSRPGELKGAMEQGQSTTASAKMPADVISEQITGNVITNFRDTQNLNSGTQITEGTNGPPHVLVHEVTFTPHGTIYTGSSLPVFRHKDETKGTRYLFDKWVRGNAIDTANNSFMTQAFWFNYDKVTRNLMLTKDKRTVVEVDKELLMSFKLFGDSMTCAFEWVPVIDRNNLLLSLEKTKGKFSLYKKVKVKFVRSNYRSDGLTEIGNPYNEYIDESRYFILYPDGKTFVQPELKVKPLKSDLANAAEGKASAYLSAHRYETVNEAFLVSMVKAMNQ